MRALPFAVRIATNRRDHLQACTTWNKAVKAVKEIVLEGSVELKQVRFWYFPELLVEFWVGWEVAITVILVSCKGFLFFPFSKPIGGRTGVLSSQLVSIRLCWNYALTNLPLVGGHV